jgi:hypothetical protein
MTQENSESKKRVSVDQVRPGMYIVGLDRSWLHTPFLPLLKIEWVT